MSTGNIYIHDDWRLWSPYDEHSIMPILIGADCVVSNSFDLVAPHTRSLLERQMVWPKDFLSVGGMGDLSSISVLLKSPEQIEQLKEFASQYQAGVSLFYPNHPKTMHLFNVLGINESCNLPSDDTDPMHRYLTLTKLRECGLLVLRGGIVGITKFNFDEYQKVVCKPGTLTPFSGQYADIIQQASSENAYIEEWREIENSYCIHYKRPNTRIGANRQIIVGYTHCGNSDFQEIPQEVVGIADEAANSLNSQSRIYGIDLIQTVTVNFLFVISMKGTIPRHIFTYIYRKFFHIVKQNLN